MAEQKEHRSNSEVERLLWFTSLEPDHSHLEYEDFKVGLGASDEIFTTVQELITQAYDNNGLENETLLPSGPDFRDTVTEVTTALIAIFETVPAQWLESWIEALILDIRNKNRAKKEKVREGKRPSPALAESPTTGADAPRILQPPLHLSPKTLPTSIKPKKPSPPAIEQKIFGLEVYPADEHQLTLFRPLIVEVMSIRCVPKGRDPKLVESYQLNLFIKEFEVVLNAEIHKQPYELAHGKLMYYYNRPGNFFGIGRGTRRTVTNQQEFEAGVAYLLTSTQTDTLTFTFFQETNQEKKRRLSGRKNGTKGSMVGELQKLKHEEHGALGSARKVSYGARMAAAVYPKGEQLAAISLVTSLSKIGDRKLMPGQSQIQKKIWGGPIKGKLLLDPRRRRAAPAQSHVPQTGSTSKAATESLDPSPGSLSEPVSKSTRSRKTRAELFPDGQRNAATKVRPTRPYPHVSSPAAIDKIPLNSPYGSALYPGATAPPPLRRKRAIINAVSTAVNNGKKLHTVIRGTSTQPENAVLFTPALEKRSLEKNEEAKTSRSVTPRISQEQHRIRQETGFHPQAPSPAVKRRSTIASIVSAKTSISFPPLPNIKNIFKRGSKDATPVDEQIDAAEDFYAEVSRKTFTRGGEREPELSIQRLKEISDIEKLDDIEVEEPEEAADFDNPDEYLVTR
ncbi:hypothetical protein N431DRAFT_520320 [Stipitochalara longipes BDJ]|nr:hypothetical protein N431DRAFT_520320 [Stipitochalara longipes BDJ]